jgi:hypothetical protein
MHYKIKLLALLLALCAISCSPKEEIINIQSENKAWLENIEETNHFIMTDSYGISESFVKSNVSCYYLEGSSHIAFFQTSATSREYCGANCSSTYGKYFSIYISASYKPLGDVMSIGFANFNFRYDLKFKQIVDIDFDRYNYRLSKTTLDTGYSHLPIINSSMEFLASYQIGSNTYTDVLHFIFNDFAEHWNSLTVTEFYIAKGYGLIKYKLNNGVECERASNHQ